MERHNYKLKFIIDTVFVGLIIGLAFVVLRYLLPLTIPFVTGLVIAFILKPITAVITKNTAFRRRSAALLVIAVFYIVISGIVLTLLAVIFSQLGSLIQRLPLLYTEGLEPLLTSFNEWIYNIMYGLDSEAAAKLGLFFDFMVSSIGTALEGLSSATISAVTGAIKGLPMFITTLLFTIISSVLISADYNSVTGFIMRQLPERWQHSVLDCKDFMVGSLFAMVRAYIIILSITILELSLGLWLLKVELFFAVAVVIALLDILPLIGTGGILIPWGIIELIRGNTFLGVGLLILLAIVTLVRNMVEPKIVGAQIGLHPIITISAMYLGLKLFGFLGLILAPLAAILIKHLNDSGRVNLYK